MEALTTQPATWTWNSWRRRPGATPDEAPLRGELLTLEALESHARGLAERQVLGTRSGPNHLLRRLARNEAVLRAFNAQTVQAERSRRITPAAEWLLDNARLVQDQIWMARRHLPRGFSRQLPHLLQGPRAGLPRVYELALDLIAHTDGRLDAAHVAAFVRGFQDASQLRLGELWAVPIMLRLALIENLRRVAVEVSADRVDRDRADAWADRVVEAAEVRSAEVIVVLGEMARAQSTMSRAFVVEFRRRAQEKSTSLKLAVGWLEDMLTQQGASLDQWVQRESQAQAATQVSVGNSIASLRFLDATDWREFVETHSVVEQVLRDDPARIYPIMDFATRDAYRHRVELLGRRGAFAEAEVARRVVSLARARMGDADPRRAHVGYYLIGRGLSEVEAVVGAKVPPLEWLPRLAARHPLPVYLGGILAVTLAGAAPFWRESYGLVPAWVSVLLVPLLLIFTSQLGLTIVNWLATLVVRPSPLPRLDFSPGIPASQATLVVVPTLITSGPGIDNLLESLEVRYLANQDAHVFFALLTDFADAAQEEQPGDAELLSRAAAGIQALNEKHRRDRPAIFFLFHRPRRWNASEQVWMGYERKRGKLAALNACLRGKGQEAFSRIVGDLSLLPRIQFVLTLDTDTQLPREAVRQLAATLAHPLNRPVFDLDRGLVVEGYSILQPRVAVSLPSAGRSRFSTLFAGDPGVDPYTRAVSDVYQDVFHEGSFIGKGIYDVDAFSQAVEGKFPENRILSHDLLEGSYARSALVSDVLLFEDQPFRYSAESQRRHRWIRGDWQIANWLLPRLPGADVRRVMNPLSALSRWKLFDNLRRSLVPVACVLVLAMGWAGLPRGAGVWTVLVAGVLALPAVLVVLTEALRCPKEVPGHLQLRSVGRVAVQHFGQTVVTLALVPFDAWFSLDAIGRTLVRLWITGRHLLEWQTSSDVEQRDHGSHASFWTTMWPAAVIAALLAVGLAIQGGAAVVIAAPVLLLWGLSPTLAWWISRPLKEKGAGLSAAEARELRRLARKTWRYFERFLGPEDHWLAPDNFQEHPRALLATRTSPTNVGLSLLATLAAYDFGYLSGSGLRDRVQRTLDTLEGLERYQGHFFNWYDTRSLEPLPPRYVSTVDNGNLAGSLLTLHSGLREMATRAWGPAVALSGLRDTLHLLRGELRDPSVQAVLRTMEVRLNAGDASPAGALAALNHVVEGAESLLGGGAEAAGMDGLRSLAREARDHRDELEFRYPWLLLGETIAVRGAAAGGEELARLWSELAEPGSPQAFLKSLAGRRARVQRWIAAETEGGADSPTPTGAGDLRELLRTLDEAGARMEQWIRQFEGLADRCDALARMDFTLLYDPSRALFSIGYNVSQHRLDASYYDLLASEARLTSFLAVALGQVPQAHWFALGRALTAADGLPGLISWSGSMFEYLMPALIMPSYENTLLDVSSRAAVNRQIEYAHTRGVPWGISESGYNLRDAQANYQYRAFGVPGLGFQRGLAEDLVIAPYATMLALPVTATAAVRNLEALGRMGGEGQYGLYEALDYTPSRVPRGQTHALVRSYMAHHQGMSLLGLAQTLLDRPMQRRFAANPWFRSAELLLHERVPRDAPVQPPPGLEEGSTRDSTARGGPLLRVFTDPNSGPPEVHLLSNGRYHVMVTHAGGGYSRWNDVALTRWREDPTRDCWGSFLYLRDLDSGESWANAYQPTLAAARSYEAIFSQGRAEFRLRLKGIDAHTEISVSPEDDVEVRRVTLTNHSSSTRTLEVTSYAEIVLNSAAADLAHPAFSNLFVQTELLPARHAILCSRRPRAPEEAPPWMAYTMLLRGREVGQTSFETDRARFLGRGRGVAAPAALETRGDLSNRAGSPLDPVAAIRRTIRLAPREAAQITLIAGVATAREGVVALVEKYQDPTLADRCFELAWTHGLIVLRSLNATEPDAQLYGRLASALLYGQSSRRATTSVLVRNRRGQRNLWSLGISGDRPIALYHCTRGDRLEGVRQVIQAHEYWRFKGLSADLVILSEDDSVYRQALHEQVVNLIASSTAGPWIDKPGGIFARRVAHLAPEDLVLLQAAARVVLSDERGGLAEQLQRGARGTHVPSVPSRTGWFGGLFAAGSVPLPSGANGGSAEPPESGMQFFNGLGGFTSDGREYVIQLRPGQTTPAPWVNVLANPSFGTLVSESGGAYTWSENAHEFRLTPWNNDPVGDPSGEAFYVRDDQTGRFWSPTPLPAPGTTGYVVRHGFGTTAFAHAEEGLASELRIFVDPEAPVKFVLIELRNESNRTRHVSFVGFWEWVLGEVRAQQAIHLAVEWDASASALLVRNAFNTDFAGRVAFVTSTLSAASFTGDRGEFLGRNGTLAQPAALSRGQLGGRTGLGLDPGAALSLRLELAPGQTREFAFLLGCGRDLEEARDLIRRFRRLEACREALAGTRKHWEQTLGALRVRTPEPALDVLANGWLLYQTLACRLWARTGFYQSGGAFGFRDQLQDAMALVHTRPKLLREQILLAAAHQFREGDVLHWWHPPLDRGVRTHFSDDYLWLPCAVARYLETVGDHGLLDERVRFLDGRMIRRDEETLYDAFPTAEESGTVYEHCLRAIRHGLRTGAHGLPLIGGGDWNDGMNLVGREGRGESVWLGFFLYDLLNQFATIARGRGDGAFAEECLAFARPLQRDLEEHGWDGHWYRRAYFDDGTPLGAALNPECQIDALPQSWAVLSGAADPERARRAMAAVGERLVRAEARLIQLFDPPFDRSGLEPGYVKGYVPGVRENGGQYTHAAIWSLMAFARVGDIDRAWEYFRLVNPVLRTTTAAGVARYRLEPYVIAADVYSVPPHVGRGGWSWYTGAAGWMYRLIVETFLGVHREGDRLRLEPRAPAAWDRYEIQYRFRETTYHITLAREGADWSGARRIFVDGQEQPDAAFPLKDDRSLHRVEVRVGVTVEPTRPVH